MKSNEPWNWKRNRSFNKEIRRQITRNEWYVGLIKKMFRLFLAIWTLDDSVFIFILLVAGMLLNYRIRRSTVTALTE